MKRRLQFPRATPYTDRHGRRRWRYRVKGFSAELGTDYGSDNFVARYEAAQARERIKGQVGSSRTRPGSFDALVIAYYRSPGFLNLSATTQAVYRREVERFREKHGAKRVHHLERRHVLKIIGEKADRPAAANFTLRMLRILLAHAVELEMRADNPALGVKGYTLPPGGFHTWTEDEIARFYAVHPAGTLAHTAMTLMLYTGASRADACALGWGNIRDGRLTYRRRKTRRKVDVVVDIPVHAELLKVLDALPRDAFTFLQTQAGASRSPNGLGNLMREWCDSAELPDCTSHGLRKACARRLAEAGATPHQIQAVTGHQTLSEVERYTREAGRSGLADDAFALMEARPKREQKLANHPARFAKKTGKPLKGQD
ncbi:MAG: site-specific integrase [Albimonas sp.]|uniref:site-specific integrase n=1 Tax=Albimonas sp. TaxID=1872425 RepID=UPI004055C462